MCQSNGCGDWAWSINTWQNGLNCAAYHGSELPIKQRRAVKCSWEDSLGCILEKLGHLEATITKIEISANEEFADPVHVIPAGFREWQ